MSCIFCDITQHTKPADIIWEDEEIVVFKDIKPSAPVHMLVVPHAHIASVKDLTEEHRDLVARLIYVARDVAEKQGLAGYKLVFNVGREGGQVIDHLHLHCMGGWGEKSPPAAAELPE